MRPRSRRTSRRVRARALVLALLLAWAPADAAGEVRVVLAGDILLSRLVAAEIGRTGASPWRDLRHLFQDADWVAGNLEGAVGSPEDCIANGETCFAISTSDLDSLTAGGFRALGVENNHSGDL